MTIDEIPFLGSDAKRFKTDNDTQTHQSIQVITSKLNLMLNIHNFLKKALLYISISVWVLGNPNDGPNMLF